MPQLIVSVHVTRDQVAAYYRGEIRAVLARAANGQTVQFPLSVLHRHITTDGIQGRFCLVFDEHNKFVRIDAVEDR